MPTESEADYLVMSLLIYPDVRNSALTSLGGLPLFDGLLMPVHAMIWDCIARLCPSCEGAKMGAASVATEMKSRFRSPSDIDKVNEALDLLREASTAKDDDLNPGYAGTLLEAFVVAAQKRDLISKLSKADTLGDFSELIDTGAKNASRIAYTGEVDLESPLSDPDIYMPDQRQIPTGVDWIDYLSGGGHCSGEMIGVLGPQGGGKTLTATTMLIAQAKQFHHCLLLSYEQGVKKDISYRLYTRLFDDMEGDLLRHLEDSRCPELRGKRVDVTFFRNYRMKDWPDAVKERYLYLKDKYDKFVHAKDFSTKIDLTNPEPQGLRGVQDIEFVLEAMERKGQLPTYMLVDWLWPAMIRWYTNMNNRRIDSEYSAAVKFLYDLKELTERKGITTVVFHQLDKDKTRAAPSVQPSCVNAWNCGNAFSQVMEHCYVIGNRDKESHVMWLGNDKARTGVPQYITGKMDGAMGIINRTDQYELSRGKFVPIGQAISEEEEEDKSPALRYM